MEIRRATTSKELAIVRGLDRVCFAHDDAYPTKGAKWWIAWDEDGEPIGYSGIKWLSEGSWFLCRIGVLPHARGRGLAGRLMKVRLRYAKKEAPEAPILTYTMWFNLPSNNNLIRHGFKLYEPEETWGGPGALHWRKDPV